MYKSFSFDNYRMFKGDHHLKLKPITIFTGANNSGKSSLLKLIYQTSQNFKECSWIDNSGLANLLETPKERKTTSQRSVIKLDNVSIYSENSYVKPAEFCLEFFGNDNRIVKLQKNMANDFDYSNTLRLEINFDAFQKYINELSLEYGKSHELKDDLRIWNENPIEVKMIREIISDDLNIRFWVIPNTKPLDILISMANNFYPDINSHILLSSILDRILIKIADSNEMANKVVKSFHNILNHIFTYQIIGSLRFLKSQANLSGYFSAFRGYYLNDPNSQASRSFNEFLIQKAYDESQAKMFSWMNKNPVTIKDFFNKWLNEFKIGLNLKDTSMNDTVPVIVSNSGEERRINEFGFGVQQLFPLLTAFAAKPLGIFFIEEPESHLHPAFQSKLADFFVDALKFPENNGFITESPQFLIETHSEYFIRKLQFLVAKGDVSADDIALYYIDNKDGSSTIKEMEFRKDGILKQDFGEGFFDESMHWTRELLNLKIQN